MSPTKARTHPLAGSGPIVDRARAALRRTAAEFGEIVRSEQTSVTVRTDDGIEVTLSYDGGNFIFSRVYNLTLTTTLPADSDVPTGLALSHRERSGPRLVRTADRGGAPDPRLAALHEAVGAQLGAVDLISAAVAGPRSARRLTLTPMGGSYVWVLIPPVFKATAFPAGEPERLLDIVRALRTWSPISA
ncbi:hypothetical protein [Leucobacter chromiireducens]|uniref:hypothetical protein n=1 Tax=Leucobacter chromiireducens TaxID=283877 RepID=UPI000F62F6E6|nr:hypothetical protein [Leucobacter chromiireducens]